MKLYLCLGTSIILLVSSIPHASSYCVYNFSWYGSIWVKDASGYYIGGAMGPHQLNMGSRVCCEGDKRGCNQGAILQFDISPEFNSTSNTQALSGCNVDAHGAVAINGGGPNPLYCTTLANRPAPKIKNNVKKDTGYKASRK